MTHTVIIGGSKGLGRVATRLFAQRGDKVSVVSRSNVPPGDLEAGNIQVFKGDLADGESADAAIRALTESNGPINYCVFLQRYRGKEDDWAGEIQITLSATKRCIETMSSRFAEGSDCGVVMVSSVFARYVGEGQALSYHVAKAGLEQMVRFYAIQLGARGIRSNGITPFTFLKEESKAFYMNNAPVKKIYEDIIPLKRMGATEDSANAIEFLCSPRASFINGQNLLVDGGLSVVWPETLARKLAGV